jgi:STE24 endopeptidase
MACDSLRVLFVVRTRLGVDLSFHLIFFGVGRIRQYPLYSKKEPPASLAHHFDEDVFDKSQKYGKDKAKFALFSGLYKQAVDSLMLHYGLYAWAWTAGGKLLSKFGFGPEYEVQSTVFVTSSVQC